jgi:AraC family transcriptional regulator of adaptative response/methylated-DNA-[protein]-cysteine methyltransferase
VPHESTKRAVDIVGCTADLDVRGPWVVSGNLAVLESDARRLTATPLPTQLPTQLEVFFESPHACVRYVEHAWSPWGPCQLGFGASGLVSLSFVDDVGPAGGAPCIHPLFKGEIKYLTLQLSGTPFQHAVWRALLGVPRGQTRSYAAIAHDIGRPRAMRAVGRAVGQNPIAWVVPCHRILPASGGLGGFRWGGVLKRQMLEAEGYRG